MSEESAEKIKKLEAMWEIIEKEKTESEERKRKLEGMQEIIEKEKRESEERKKKLDLIERDLKKQAEVIEQRMEEAEKLFLLSADKNDMQEFFGAVTDLYYKWCAENETGLEEFMRAVKHSLELRKLMNRGHDAEGRRETGVHGK